MLARDEIIEAARDDLGSGWGATPFSVVSERRFRTWWRRTRVELVIDVGWEPALARVVIDTKTGEVVGVAKIPRTGSELILLDEQAAARIAKYFAHRAGWSMWDDVSALHHGGRWYVHNRIFGMPQTVVICDHSGAVLHPRPGDPYRPEAPPRSPRAETPIRNRTALLLAAKDDCAAMYGDTPFEVVEEHTSYRWWGRREITFTIDVGWARALVEYVMNERNGDIVHRSVSPRPDVAFTPITKDEAIAAAAQHAARHQMSLPRAPDGPESDGRWVFSDYRPDMIGSGSGITVCGTAGVVLDHLRRPR